MLWVRVRVRVRVTLSGRNKKQKMVLLDSGDVLATISKVKRRRRHYENDVNNNTDRAGGNKNVLL